MLVTSRVHPLRQGQPTTWVRPLNKCCHEGSASRLPGLKAQLGSPARACLLGLGVTKVRGPSSGIRFNSPGQALAAPGGLPSKSRKEKVAQRAWGSGKCQTMTSGGSSNRACPDLLPHWCPEDQANVTLWDPLIGLHGQPLPPQGLCSNLFSGFSSLSSGHPSLNAPNLCCPQGVGHLESRPSWLFSERS